MIVVSTTGYFLTVFGPYLADFKNSDASIMKHMIQTNSEVIKTWVNKDDVFIVDRGFCDSLSLLQDIRIQTEMPCFLRRGEKHFPTEDANTTRLVSKVRWVVESANARIKKWKYLAHVLPTNQVPFIGDFVRIACAIANRFSPPLSAAYSEEDVALAERMTDLSRHINTLQLRVETEHLDRRSAIWKPAEDVHDFPRLDEKQIRSYQLKLSSSCMQEHLDGQCDVQVHREDDTLIRVWMRSRHVSSKTYLLWIEHNATDAFAWYMYCRCRAGARVVGVCSHIASIVWYLGYVRYIQKTAFGVRNWGTYLDDAAAIPDSVDETDSQDSVVEEYI